jgi:hypothetical protein
MDELNEPASNFRLLQVDFYNILSPMSSIASTIADEGEELVENEPDFEPEILIEGSQEYQDYWIRQQIMGFSSELDPNEFRKINKLRLQNQTLPLKSMRIQIKEGMSTSWAPNGYGKTYIFDLLSRIKNHDPKIHEGFSAQEDLVNYDFNYRRHYDNWIKEKADLIPEGSAKGLEILPYHALGFIVEVTKPFSRVKNDLAELQRSENGHRRRYAVIFPQPVTSTDEATAFVRRMHYDDREIDEKDMSYYDDFTLLEDESDLQESGWAYTKNKSWFQVSKHQLPGPNDYIKRVSGEYPDAQDFGTSSNTSVSDLLSSALASFMGLDVTYVETPSWSDKDEFGIYVKKQVNKLIKHQVEFRSNEYVQRGIFKKQPISLDSNSFLYCLQNIHDELIFFTDSMGIGLSDRITGFPQSHQQRIEELMSMIENESENLLGDFWWDRNIWVSDLIGASQYLKEILFTTSNHNNSYRFDTFDKLHEIVEECATESLETPFVHLSAIMNVFRLERLYQTMNDDPLSPSNEALYKHLEYMISQDHVYSKFRAFLISQRLFSKYHWLWGRDHLDVVDSLDKRFSFSRQNEKSTLYSLFEGERGTSLYEKAMKCVEEALDSFMGENDPFAPINDDEKYFPWYLPNVGIFETTDYTHRFEYLVEEFFDTREFTTHLNPLQAWDLFYPKEKPLGINPYLVNENLNRCIDPNDMDDPWSVRAKISWGVSTGRHLPITFHPSKLESNSIKPQNLSFGMRSEIILQLALTNLLYDMRSKKGEGFKLLVLDESEVGRSEYWTEKLIQRFQRLEKQMGQSSGFQTLIVSHRGLLLERSSSSSYFIMHRVPETLDDEDDDEF